LIVPQDKERANVGVISMSGSRMVAGWLWKAIVASLVCAILAVVFLLIIALAGISDPPRIGQLLISDEFENSGTGWVLEAKKDSSDISSEIREGSYQVSILYRKTSALVLSPYVVYPPCSIVIAARQLSGAPDTGYGIQWGDIDSYTVTAVNSDSYITIFTGDGAILKEWQPFPRIRPQFNVNTIQVDLTGIQVSVKVNDENVVTFAQNTSAEGISVGFYAETFSAGEAVIAFEWLKVWQTPQ
jgi:hypothetical protein